ncbi:MAG: arsenate reductase family protein [Oscillospiraceae bacterium]|nr:arsenate reductase family protein [Oscillospiraceae bacterium]
MLFLCYPKCTTCKKAQRWLDENGLTYTLRDIKTDNPTAAELADWQKRSGLPLKRFFNTSGQLYRELELSKKLPDMPEAEQLSLLASDGMLVKRPILVTEQTVLVGFRETEWDKLK